MPHPLTSYLTKDGRRAVENVCEAAARIWSRPLHRHYTDHTVAHSERVIALLDGLTEGMMGTDKRLSGTEILVLLAAAYLHDVGADSATIRALFESEGWALERKRKPGQVPLYDQVERLVRELTLFEERLQTPPNPYR